MRKVCEDIPEELRGTLLSVFLCSLLSPVQTSKFSLTSFLTSSLTRMYGEQVFLDKLYLFVCTRNLTIIFLDNFYEAAVLKYVNNLGKYFIYIMRATQIGQNTRQSDRRTIFKFAKIKMPFMTRKQRNFACGVGICLLLQYEHTKRVIYRNKPV